MIVVISDNAEKVDSVNSIMKSPRCDYGDAGPYCQFLSIGDWRKSRAGNRPFPTPVSIPGVAIFVCQALR